ncbi:hypothetical protein GCM10007967_09990 [Xylanimonas ulmi]
MPRATTIPAGIRPTPFDPDAYDYSDLPPRTVAFDGTSPEQAIAQVRGVIEYAAINSPRSLQKRIGPSEIGNPCDHCLAAKLAGWAETEDGIAWLPFVGTAVHAELERIVNAYETSRNAMHTTGRRWLCEQRVTVGQIGGVDITGSTDLFDVAAGMPVDHKIVGPTKIKKVKSHGPGPTYRVQAHAYGRGWVAAGYEVRHVAIWFLPRNDMRGFDGGLLWHEPYQEQIAVDALARANRLHANLTALAALGTAARDAWISSLPRDPDCFDCARYPDRPAGLAAPGHRPQSDTLAGLIP